jgi:hypothetical protein
MTRYLCEIADKCSDLDCPHHAPHGGERNAMEVNMCTVPTPCLKHTRRLIRCLPCYEPHENRKEKEEKAIYFIKKEQT